MVRLNDKFGKWKLLKKPNDGSVKALFICECGKKQYVNFSNVKRGLSTQCTECQSKRTALRMTTHGMSTTALHNVWSGIKRRCYNKNQKSYKYYGAKGVLMCNEWRHSFEVFSIWAMDNGYKKGMAISRFGDSGHYCPNNCKIQTILDNAKEINRQPWTVERSIERSLHLSKLSEDNYFKVIEMSISGEYKSKEICEEYSLDRHILLGMIKRQGLEPSWRKTLLTNEQIEELVTIRFEQNLSTTELGAIYGVSHECIVNTLVGVGRYVKLKKRK